jgi:hypothetical protein
MPIVFRKQQQQGDNLLYLTTQDLEHGVNGRPDIISPPLTHLQSKGMYPLQPELMGNLVLQNMNLWMGHTGIGNAY